MIYIKLFYVFAKLGIFTYGGGYAIIAVLLNILGGYGWISFDEFSNLLAISQITPGPIAVNAATFVGYKVAGIFGSFMATFGIFVPAFFITMIVSKFFYKLRNNLMFHSIMECLRISALALIASTLIIFSKDAFFLKLTETSILNNKMSFINNLPVNIISILIFLLSLFLKIKKVPIIVIVIISGILGIILY